MPTKLPTAFRLYGRTVDSVRSEHQRCQAAEPAFSNGESCFGQALLARHAFASGFINQLSLSMSTEVEAQNARSQLVGDPQDSRVNLALKSVTPRSYSIYSIPHIAQYLDPYTLPFYILFRIIASPPSSHFPEYLLLYCIIYIFYIHFYIVTLIRSVLLLSSQEYVPADDSPKF